MRKLLRNERTAVPKNMNVTVAFLITDGRLKEQFFHILPGSISSSCFVGHYLSSIALPSKLVCFILGPQSI